MIVVLALVGGCAGDDTQESPPDASATAALLDAHLGEAGPSSEVADESGDGGGRFRLPAIDLSKLDAEAISRLQGVYLVKTINGYRIVCWQDGRVQVQTPRGETCSKNVGVTGRNANVHVQSRSSPDDAVIAIHGVEVVRDGACVP